MLRESSRSYWERCFEIRSQDIDSCDETSGSFDGTLLETDPGRRRLRTLDDEIEAIAELLRSAKTRHNDACYASRLSDDLLALVFKAWIDDTVADLEDEAEIDHVPRVQDEDTISFSGYADTTGTDPPRFSTPDLLDSAWVVCSFVCQRWRRVALGTPSLWRDVPLDLGPQWLRRFLARSRGVPQLRFYGNISYPSIPPYHWTLDLSRTEVLSLRARDRSIFWSFLGWPRSGREGLTALRRIELSAATTTHYSDTPCLTRCSMPLGSWLSASPYIQKVSLSNVPVEGKAPSSPIYNLTHLSIINDVCQWSGQPCSSVTLATTPEDVVELLKMTPALRTLILIDAFYWAHSQQSMQMDVVAYLPRLEVFVWDDHIGRDFNEDFLDHIDHPSAQTRLFFSNPSPILEDKVDHIVRQAFSYFQKFPPNAEGGTLALLYNPPSHTSFLS
ncbi:hypothetical protein BC834DRAFT_237180 [Gloeopeniophorella convolvens]|nr:hypothetical protein BC834DRAFT_237180 [Gloeopeniophorella convolvens]